MSVFDYFKGKTLNEKGDIVTKEEQEIFEKETFEQKVEITQPVEEPEEWIWIDGYKGTNSNMCCRNNFQFELNKTFAIDGDIELCENGFHFCKTLKDVFCFYNLNSDKPNRYFKVKALVSTKQMKEQEELYLKKLEEYHSNIFLRNRPSNIKFVAKEIIFTEEISFEELFPYIKDNFDYVTTEEDWSLVHKIGYRQYKRNYFINKMDGLGFGETFLNVLYDEIGNVALEPIVQFAQALKEENVSKDMAVYLLLKNANRKRD